MDNLSNDNIEIALTQYQLLSCNAELMIKPESEGQGGIFELTSEVNTPSEPAILKKDDEFTINMTLEIMAKVKESEDIAFSASCKYEGNYRVINCGKNGVPTENNFKFWALAINQLHPLVSQFMTDIVLKMGFKNFSIPLIMPGRYGLKSHPEKVLPKRLKNKK